MAPPVTEDQNIIFLLSCIRNSQGPINFAKVVEECDIVSIGAASKRFSRLSIKYPAGAGSDHANGGEEGMKQDSPPETDDSPTKKTPKKANRRGNGVVKNEKDTMAAITAPRAAGVGKKRSPTKPKAAAPTTAASTLATAAMVEGGDLKMGNGAEDDAEAGEFVSSFFDEQMDRGVGGEHGGDTD